jgi:alpha-galactosidase
MKNKAGSAIKIHHLKQDLAIAELDNASWANSPSVAVNNYWSGESAPVGRHFTARLLWSDTALYVRFEANQAEPLIVADKPDITKKTKGLWDRDVCEIFIAPDRDDRNRYFEFEIAPTGEWIDLAMHMTPKERETDWEYASGMTSSVRIEKAKVIMAIRIPWKALGRTPKAGGLWLGNLFRCVGKDPTRGYLSWKATMTKKPNFHVPAKFGEFEFVK